MGKETVSPDSDRTNSTKPRDGSSDESTESGGLFGDAGRRQISRRSILAGFGTAGLVSGAGLALSSRLGAGASGSTLYVDPDGSDDDPGTASAPFGSLDRATAELDRLADPAGTTILVRGGDYTVDSSIIVGTGGTAADPVRIEAAGDALPSFDLSGTDDGINDAAVSLSSVRHLRFRGLEFHGSAGHGVALSGSCDDVHVEDCQFHDNRNNGLSCFFDDSAGSNVVRRCESYGNAGGSVDSDGFAVGRDPSGGSVRFERCRAHHNADDGFDFFYGNGNEVWDSVAWANGYDRQRNDIAPSGGGNGFKIGGAGDSGPIDLYRCVAYENANFGVMDNENVSECGIYNVTAWNNENDDVNCWGDGNHEIRNCISYGGGVYLESHHDDRANSWNLGIDDPAFRSLDPDSDGFLRLQRDSPCVDAGVDVGVEYNGSAPDLGAFEFEAQDHVLEVERASHSSGRVDYIVETDGAVEDGTDRGVGEIGGRDTVYPSSVSATVWGGTDPYVLVGASWVEVSSAGGDVRTEIDDREMDLTDRTSL